MNCQLPIANCQLLAARRGFARRCKNGRQFSRFLVQVLEPVRGYKLIFTDQLQPKLDFVSFLFGDTDLCNKFSARTGFARCPVICRSRSASACNLIRKDSAFNASRKLVCQIQNAESELLRTVF